MMTIWVASFGGALHAPVTTFFYLQLGATEMDIGWLAFVGTFGSLLLAPFYGWLLDKRSAFLALVLSCLMCSTGCLIRGFAVNLTMLFIGAVVLGLGAGSLWTTVLSFVSRGSPKEIRPLVVSGYLFQVTSLRILGKSLYPGWNYFVEHVFGVKATLPRYRIHMAVCTLFCFYGFYKLLKTGRQVMEDDMIAQRGTKNDQIDETELELSEDDDETEMHLLDNDETPRSNTSTMEKGGVERREDNSSSKKATIGFALVAVAVVSQSFAQTVGTLLWPFFIKDRFLWGTSEYSMILFLTSITTTAGLAFVPKCERSFGATKTAIVACIVSAVSASLSFLFDDPNKTWGIVSHVALMGIFLTAVQMLDPILQITSSLHMPKTAQGRTFGTIATLRAIGRMIGNLVGPLMYAYSKQTHVGSGMPLWIVGAVLIVASILLGIAGGNLESYEEHNVPLRTKFGPLLPKRLDKEN